MKYKKENIILAKKVIVKLLFYSWILMGFFIKSNAQSADKNAQELFNAIKIKDVSAVKKYIKKVNNPASLRNAEGETLLHTLFWNTRDIWGQNEREILNILLQNGCDVNAKAGQYDTPVLVAAAKFAEPLKILIQHGADVRQGTPLVTAVFNYCLECVQILVESGADIHQKTSYGHTPLLAALDRYDGSKVSLPIIKYLIEKGADTRVTTSKGETLMDLAITKNKNPEVKEYLQSLNIKSNYDHTQKTDKMCSTCGGSGWAGEKQEVWKTCNWCNGKGRIVRDRTHVGADMTVKTHNEYDCNNCKGKGKVFLHYESVPCRTCNGKGFIKP